MTTATIEDVLAELRALRALVSAPSTKHVEAPRRSIPLAEAARVYGTDRKKLQALFDAGKISGRKVPGRSRSRVELRLFVPSLDSFFSGGVA